jgi:YbbR domain-containing protein
VDVRLRGSSGTLGRLVPGDTSAVIDLRSARPGRRLFHITTTQIKVPYGLNVVQIAPATLPITFENAGIRVVQVRPAVEGRPAPGYELGAITTDPATVEIVGPESALRGLDEALTEPVSVANATRLVREVVTVGVADPSVRLRSPQTAAVTVQIVSGAATRTLTGIPVEVRNLDNGVRARATPATVAVMVRGTDEALQTLTASNLVAHVDAGGAKAGERGLEVQVRAGPGLTVASVTPRVVKVRVGTRD